MVVLHGSEVPMTSVRSQLGANDELVAVPYDPSELKNKIARLVQRPTPVSGGIDREHRSAVTVIPTASMAVCTP